jgi:hypothetical protein
MGNPAAGARRQEYSCQESSREIFLVFQPALRKALTLAVCQMRENSRPGAVPAVYGGVQLWVAVRKPPQKWP